jgi:NOL1/NOP2/fmu family ribosome biogenesis protein
VGWNSRHSPQELCLLAKLLNTDHVLNVSSVSARPWMVGSSVEANPHVTF